MRASFGILVVVAARTVSTTWGFWRRRDGKRRLAFDLTTRLVVNNVVLHNADRLAPSRVSVALLFTRWHGCVRVEQYRVANAEGAVALDEFVGGLVPVNQWALRCRAGVRLRCSRWLNLWWSAFRSSDPRVIPIVEKHDGNECDRGGGKHESQGNHPHWVSSALLVQSTLNVKTLCNTVIFQPLCGYNDSFTKQNQTSTK